MVRPTVFALLIIIAAYLPIFLLQRVEGRIFAPMANTVVSALAGALFFSVTLVPVLAALVCRGARYTTASRPLLRVAARALRRHAALLPRAPGAVLGSVSVPPRRCGLHPAAAGKRVPPRAQRGRALHDLHPPVERLARPRAGGSCRASPSCSPEAPQVECGALAARPARGRDRREAGQQPRVLRQAEAAGPVAAPRSPPLRRPRRPARSWIAIPGHRGELQPAHPRQRQREHQRPVRADRGEALRRRPGGAPGAGGEGEGGHRQGARAWPTWRMVKSGWVPQVQSQAGPHGAGPPRDRTWATSSTCSRPRSAGARWRTSGRASAGSTWCCGSRSRRATTWRRSVRSGCRWRAGNLVALGALAEVGTRLGPGEHQPRERPPLHRHPDERPGPGHGRLRQRGQGEAGA